jgi:hypothetical protein
VVTTGSVPLEFESTREISRSDHIAATYSLKLGQAREGGQPQPPIEIKASGGVRR